MTKREEMTLFDEWLVLHKQSKQLVSNKNVEMLTEHMKKARKFVLDHDASTRFAEIVRDVPEELVKYQSFARAPYATTWVEYNADIVYRVLTGKEPDDNADMKVGFLVVDDSAYSITSGKLNGKDMKTPVVMPLCYDLHKPWSFKEQLDFCNKYHFSRLTLAQFFWGSVFASVSTKQAVQLRDAHSVRVMFDPKYERASVNIASLLTGSAGELRNIVAMLLLLNRPSLTRYVRDVPPRKGFVRGKLKNFMAHTVVTIPLDPKPAIRRISEESDGTSKRRHEVRGHYCHDEDAREYARIAGCVHDWTQDDADHWHCEQCGGKRWWRHEHLRGDAAKGFVEKSYNVTAS